METANIIEPITKTKTDKEKEDEEYKEAMRLFGFKEEEDGK